MTYGKTVPARLHGAPHSGAARMRRSPAEITSDGRTQIGTGAPARPDGRGTAGAHIAELIHTMLERKASGIDLR
ncbi:hypothetical protein CE91St41_32640 [Oscillospiraceae bacterium]|nr:hypothetical protein CE91St40_32640 [Oscillospiraceae bacterium]BDF76375.1 hypothetical protein CE91St41_32640 [Oscillospiraceae bacterium]